MCMTVHERNRIKAEALRELADDCKKGLLTSFSREDMAFYLRKRADRLDPPMTLVDVVQQMLLEHSLADATFVCACSTCALVPRLRALLEREGHDA